VHVSFPWLQVIQDVCQAGVSPPRVGAGCDVRDSPSHDVQILPTPLPTTTADVLPTSSLLLQQRPWQ
jgi:hypothetical protein